LPFFCVHGLGGGVLDYTHIAREMSQEQPFYGIQAPEVDGRYLEFDTIEAMAAYYVDQIRSFQSQGPYLLGGYSLGGVIAFEMAQQLLSQNQQIALVAMFDSEPPGEGLVDRLRGLGREVPYFIANVPGWLVDFRQLSSRVRLSRLRRKLLDAVGIGLQVFGLRLDVVEPGIGDYYEDVSVIPDDRRELIEMHLRALRGYVSKKYPGRLTVFRAGVQPLLGAHTPDLGWQRLASGGVGVHIVSGSHHTLLKEPHATLLAQALQECLDGLQLSRAAQNLGDASAT
jgi:thioesterase domain-containing protein